MLKIEGVMMEPIEPNLFPVFQQIGIGHILQNNKGERLWTFPVKFELEIAVEVETFLQELEVLSVAIGEVDGGPNVELACGDAHHSIHTQGRRVVVREGV